MTETAASPAPDAAPLPSPGWVGAPRQKDRVLLLDAARGLGVLGILPCNLPDFAYPLNVGEGVRAWPHGAAWPTLLGWAATQMFFQRRFVTLFSMMFGVSLFLVGGERSDAERGLILRKRLFVLLAIGLAHCFLIWWGDILVSYALGGLIVLFLRSKPPATLLRIGLTVLAVMMTAYALGAVFQNAPQALAQAPSPAKQAKAVADAIAAYQGGFVGSLVANARDGLKAQMGQLFVVPWTVSLMCIGLAAYKWGVFTGEAPRGVYWALLGGGLAVLAVIVLGYSVFLISGLDKAAGSTAFWVQTALAAPNSFAYVAVLFFALGSRFWRWLPTTLAPVGQMAFTNYLTQSLMMTALFYPGRGPNLYAKVDRPGLWAICVAVWVLQIVWSRIWLTYFTMGPLEWAWRRLYRGPAPLRRARPGPPTLTVSPAL